MIKRYNPIGFHTGAGGGNTKGLTSYFERLDGAGVPFQIKAAGDYNRIREALTYNNAPHVRVFRLTERNSDWWSDVPNYDAQPAGAARAHFDRTMAALPGDFDRSRVWLEPINEVDKGRAEWLAEFALEFTLLAEQEELELLWFGWSAGEPELDHWTGPAMTDLLVYMNESGLHGLSLHEYSYSAGDLWRLYDFDMDMGWLVGRVAMVVDTIKDAVGYCPPIHISEFGWEYQNVPGVARGMEELRQAADMYARIPEILGASLWYLGPGYGDIHNQVNRYIDPVTQFSLDYSIDLKDNEPPTVDGPPVPFNILPYRVVVNVLPQDATLEEKRDILDNVHERRETMTQSHEDGAYMVAMGKQDGVDGPPSLLRIHGSGRQPHTVELAESLGIDWESVPMTGTEPPVDPGTGGTLPPGWLESLKQTAGPLFRVSYVTTSRFDVPRSYGRHEGNDFDIIGGPVDSKEPVLAAFSGRVRHSGYGPIPGYGSHVIVDSTHEGIKFSVWYCHLEQDPPVGHGEYIVAGEPVGELGSTGNSTAEHVHVNVQVPGYGATGYSAPSVIDPLLVLKESVIYSAPVGRFTMSEYVKGLDGFQYMVQLTNGPQERYRTVDLPGGWHLIQKNELWELWKNGTHLVADCSPEGTPDGRPLFYRTTQPGEPGARYFADKMDVGVGFTNGGHHVQFHLVNGCQLWNKHPTGHTANNTVILRHHPTFQTPFGHLARDVIETTDGVERHWWERWVGRIGYKSPWVPGGAWRTGEFVRNQEPFRPLSIGCFPIRDAALEMITNGF